MSTSELPSRALPEEFDLRLPSGTVHAQRFGLREAPLVLCLPGLSANMKVFDFMGERLGGKHWQIVALDLRGRGRSDTTPSGTYGWKNHARDVFAAADALGAAQFSLIGQSMGAFITLQAAAIHASRIERAILIDACGDPDPAALPLIEAAVNRLGATYPSVEAYLELVQRIGTIRPWSNYWARYFRYELEPVEGGVRARSNRDAVLEDAAYPSRDNGVDCYALWQHLRMPVLLLRALQELMPGYGFIVSEQDRDRFAHTVAQARVVEVDANHYGINTAEASVAAIKEFLR